LHEPRHLPAIVVGAGPAGLATSHELARHGIDHLVFERGDSVAASWRCFYTSLVLHTGKHLSSLPGLPFGRNDPLFVPRAQFIAYLERYAESERLPVRTGIEVRAATPTEDGWRLETSSGSWDCGVLVVATGIATSPRSVQFAGHDTFTGTVRHSVAYRDPAPFLGRRVLVVGAGNSGAEIAAELGAAGVETTIAVRSGVIVVPLTVAGVPSQYLGIALRRLPRTIATPIARAVVALGVRRRRDGLPRSDADPLGVIPIVGLHLSDAIRAGRVRLRGGVVSLGPSSATFMDGSEVPVDDIILAVGFRSAIGWLDPFVGRDERGFARRRDRVASIEQPRLLFVGHTYDAGGGLVNIRRDSRLAAQAARTLLSS
jgi:cation diffusion facilitator CzcD-associated flavoprotein CzcO